MQRLERLLDDGRKQTLLRSSQILARLTVNYFLALLR